MCAMVVSRSSPLNPSAAEFVPTKFRRSQSRPTVSSPERRGNRGSSSPDRGRAASTKKQPMQRWPSDGESRSVSPRGPSSLASQSSGSSSPLFSSSPLPARSFKNASLQQLKVHGPGCECQRLRRVREKLGADSGYLVVSRDARAPDVHFGAAHGFFPPASDESRDERRDREARLAAAIATSEMPTQRVSCAACLLDGDWRNGAVCWVGTKDHIAAACERANTDKTHMHKRVIIHADDEHGEMVVTPNIQPPPEDDDDDDDDDDAVVAEGDDSEALEDQGVMVDPDVLLNGPSARLSVCTEGGGQLVLSRCVCIEIARLRAAVDAGADDKAEIRLPFARADDENVVEERPVVVDVKHHVLEGLDVVPLDDDCFVLALTYVDARGVVSLDFPGGKRHLGETAWEAAARETADECVLERTDIGQPFTGAGANLVAGDVDLTVKHSVDGQSVRFFVLRQAEATRSEDACKPMEDEGDRETQPEDEAEAAAKEDEDKS